MTIKVKNLQALAKKENLEEKIARICEENDIVFMALFGSFVRGDQKKRSDIDILIRFDETKEKSLLDLIHAENELKKVFKRKVDLLTVDSISPYMREEVLNSMRVIYEKGVFSNW